MRGGSQQPPHAARPPSVPLFGGDPMSRVILPGPPCPAETPQAVWDAVLAYRPDSVLPVEWTEVRPFVLDIMVRLAPKTWGRASLSILLLARYCAWAVSIGLAQDVEVVLHPDRLDYWVSTVLNGTPTAGNYYCRLAKIGRAVTRRAPWETPHSVSYKRTLRPPYLANEMALWERLEGEQSNAASTRIFTGIHRLCAGAGTAPGECLRATAEDVFRADGLLWLRIGGEQARDVPVADRHADALERLAARHPNGTLLGVNPDAKNALGNAVKRLRLDRQHSHLSAQRLRTTWLVNRLAARVELPDLLAYAGLTSTGWIADLIEFLPDSPDDVAARAVIDP